MPTMPEPLDFEKRFCHSWKAKMALKKAQQKLNLPEHMWNRSFIWWRRRCLQRSKKTVIWQNKLRRKSLTTWLLSMKIQKPRNFWTWRASWIPDLKSATSALIDSQTSRPEWCQKWKQWQRRYSCMLIYKTFQFIFSPKCLLFLYPALCSRREAPLNQRPRQMIHPILP